MIPPIWAYSGGYSKSDGKITPIVIIVCLSIIAIMLYYKGGTC